MTPGDFRFVQSLMLRKAGITVWSEKRYFVERRLAEVARVLALPSDRAVVEQVRDGSRPVEMRLIEALLPSDTHFFRDLRPFELLEKAVIPELIAARAPSRRLRIWCCAAGTGQEAYSAAMVLARHAEALVGWTVDLLATDVSPSAIARARTGRYDHFEVQRGLPIRELMTHFSRDGEDWTVSPALRQAVRFEEVNLAHETVAGPFDIVLCRYLVMHLDARVKRALLDRVAQAMAQDGVLLLGTTESVIGLTTRLVPDAAQPGLYRRRWERVPATGLQRLAALG